MRQHDHKISSKAEERIFRGLLCVYVMKLYRCHALYRAPKPCWSFVGTSSFRIQKLRAHDSSKFHVNCSKAICNPKCEREWLKAVQHCGKRRASMPSYPNFAQLVKRITGHTYFTESIADVIKNLKLLSKNFMQGDSCVMVALMHHMHLATAELVYVRYMYLESSSPCRL